MTVRSLAPGTSKTFFWSLLKALLNSSCLAPAIVLTGTPPFVPTSPLPLSISASAWPCTKTWRCWSLEAVAAASPRKGACWGLRRSLSGVIVSVLLSASPSYSLPLTEGLIEPS